MVYLFTGKDGPAKQEKIASLKKQLFSADTESFNYDSFYAKELDLPLFQELLSRLPVSAKQRLLVIKDALKLSPEIQEYLRERLSLSPGGPQEVVIVLDIGDIPKERSVFLGCLLKAAKTLDFKSAAPLNAFDLARAIEHKSAERALNILAGLLADGERPERILGALRYQFIRPGISPAQSRDKIRMLLETDNNLKTGRIKGSFALETLVVRLCRA